MIKNITIGIKAYIGSFALISKLKLWKYFFIPIIISVVTGLIIMVSAWGLSDNLGAYIANIWPWEFGKDTFTGFSSLVGGALIVILGLMLYKHIVMAFSAPFMSPVSEKIEAHLTGIEKHSHRKTTFKEQLVRGIRINIRNLFKSLLYSIPLIIIGFIPVIGIACSALLFLIQAYYAGFGNIDYTMERHFKYKESVDFVRRNRGVAIGNGIVFMLFLLIPFVGIILVLPLSVTASSLNTVKLLQKENLLTSK